MDDKEIFRLFAHGDENALKEADAKYGRYCFNIAYNILGNRPDAEECINEAFYNIWKSVPEKQPDDFRTFLGRYVRNASLKKLRNNNAVKRGGGEIHAAFEELSEFIPSDEKVSSALDAEETAKIINSFLGTLSKRDHCIFVRRYWYFDSVSSISEKYGFSESKVKSILFRTRNRLKKKLNEEGVYFE